jgi:hypothetical protein
VLIEGNVFDGSWADGQVGYALLFKSVNQGGNCNWCATRDVTVRYNIIQNAGAGFNLTGREGGNPYPVGELLNRVLIEQNIMQNIDTGPYTGDSKYFQLLQNLSNLTIRSNTMTSPTQVTQFLSLGSSPAATGLDYQNNITTYGQYGLFSSATEWRIRTRQHQRCGHVQECHHHRAAQARVSERHLCCRRECGRGDWIRGQYLSRQQRHGGCDHSLDPPSEGPARGGGFNPRPPFACRSVRARVMLTG